MILLNYILLGFFSWQMNFFSINYLSQKFSLSSNLAAIFVIMFLFGWNQFLYPMLLTTDPNMKTIVMAVDSMIPTGDDYAHWPTVFASAMLAMLPPIVIIITMQKFFVKGLLESDK